MQNFAIVYSIRFSSHRQISSERKSPKLSLTQNWFFHDWMDMMAESVPILHQIFFLWMKMVNSITFDRTTEKLLPCRRSFSLKRNQLFTIEILQAKEFYVSGSVYQLMPFILVVAQDGYDYYLILKCV